MLALRSVIIGYIQNDIIFWHIKYQGERKQKTWSICVGQILLLFFFYISTNHHYTSKYIYEYILNFLFNLFFCVASFQSFQVQSCTRARLQNLLGTYEYFSVFLRNVANRLIHLISSQFELINYIWYCNRMRKRTRSVCLC